MNTKLLRDSAKLKIFRQDNSDYTADFDEYTLSSVRVVPHYETTPEMEPKNTVSIYYFPSVSICKDENGTTVSLPHVKYGDEALITLDEEEKSFRISGAEYRNGIGDATHVKLRLE